MRWTVPNHSLLKELKNAKQEIWQLIRKSSAREMDVKMMEKEISEGKRICMGVVGSELEESLPLRKVNLAISNTDIR